MFKTVWSLLLLCTFCHNSGTLNTEEREMAMLRVLWSGDQTKTVSELKHRRLEGCGLCVRWVSRITTPLSHGSILLPRLVGRRASRSAQGGGQGTEEASQQCETEASPGTKHGPAIAMANVFREAVHVAGVAGQLKVDSCHTCAQGDDTACSCKRRKEQLCLTMVPIHILWESCYCRTLICQLMLTQMSSQLLPSKHRNWITLDFVCVFKCGFGHMCFHITSHEKE